jgi:hypothetical protein
MFRTKRHSLSFLAVALAALGVVACAATPEDVAAERRSALSSYLQGEKLATRDVLATFEDVYSDAEVTADFAGDPAGEDFPPVTITFTYTYVDSVIFRDYAPGEIRPSWVESRPKSERNAMQAELLTVCTSEVIPGIREAGIAGPVTVHYVYLNGGWASGVGPSWEVTCSD